MKKKLERPVSSVPCVRIIRYHNDSRVHIAFTMGVPGTHYESDKGSASWLLPKDKLEIPDTEQVTFAFRGETVSPRLASIFHLEWYEEGGNEMRFVHGEG